MVNKATTAGHIPERTCVVCKVKSEKPNMMRFIIRSGDYVIDCKQRLAGRGYYLCRKIECVEGIDKWISKKGRKRRKKR